MVDVNFNVNVVFGPSKEVPPWATQLLQQVGLIISQSKVENMALSKSVQDLVNEVAESTSIQQASAKAIGELVKQSSDLKAKVDELTAAGSQMSAEDAEAIAKAVSDLDATAKALQSAVPQNVPPENTTDQPVPQPQPAPEQNPDAPPPAEPTT
jgi:peptidoglycan hydrolase CwlO-like protein